MVRIHFQSFMSFTDLGYAWEVPFPLALRPVQNVHIQWIQLPKCLSLTYPIYFMRHF